MTCRNAVVFLEEIYSLNFILLFQSNFLKQLLLVKNSVTSLSPSGSVTGADEAPYRIERELIFFSKCFFHTELKQTQKSDSNAIEISALDNIN